MTSISDLQSHGQLKTGTATLTDWARTRSAQDRRKSLRVTLLRGTLLQIDGLKAAENLPDQGVIGRLSDLGISPGETIEFLGAAPLGEPLYVSVRDTVLALRFEEASRITVTEL